MAEYVRNIIIVGVCASLAVTALPKNAESSGRHVRQLSAFLILAVILSPLSKMSDVIYAVKNGIDDIITISENTVESDLTTEELVCAYIVELLHSKYSFDRDETEVKLILSESGESISEIQIFTSVGRGEYFASAEAYIEELFGAEAHVFGVGIER